MSDKMTIEKATESWVERYFAEIPTLLVKRAFMDNPEDLVLLSSKDPELDWPAGWGSMFHPCHIDEEWIRDHVKEVEECGFIVYESDETGIILGIDGAGYDFYEQHWIPLYKARGLEWHL